MKVVLPPNVEFHEHSGLLYMDRRFSNRGSCIPGSQRSRAIPGCPGGIAWHRRPTVDQFNKEIEALEENHKRQSNEWKSCND